MGYHLAVLSSILRIIITNVIIISTALTCHSVLDSGDMAWRNHIIRYH
ncbi:hypothetical protein IL54_2428 [Sphingobium sp. ba1]|nr:hypothetical protein IL54_2428 [Sphingobium sp. ba1]